MITVTRLAYLSEVKTNTYDTSTKEFLAAKRNTETSDVAPEVK